MKYLWTRYSIKFPSAIIYMLQGSEYNIAEYFTWLHRTKNFQTVMQKRKLVRTKKASLLLFMAWIIWFFLVCLACLLFSEYLLMANFVYLLISIILLILIPYIISYTITAPLIFGQILIQNPKQRKMVAKAHQIFVDNPALKIAIAGSYGKTTMKEILRTVLSEGKKVAFTPGNMNTPIGISRFANTLDGNEEVIVFELGEQKVGDITELCELINPDMGIITGINEAHLSTFGSLQNTVSTIFELKDYLSGKKLYVNGDDSLVASKINADDKYVFGNNGTDGWQIINPKVDINGTNFTAKKGIKKIIASSGLLGVHNLGFISVAIDIADTLGLTTNQITEGINNTTPFEHRLQPKDFHGALMIDDTYNGNSEGVKAGLALLKSLDAKRRIYITPGLVEQGDKNQEIHEKIGQQAAKVADIVVLMKNSVTEYIKSGLEKANFKGKLTIIDDSSEFYANLDQFIAVGDVFLMQNDWTDNYE